MARKVFFSFHYERDVWRVGQIRNSWLTKPDRESAGFWDSASWESVKKQGDDAIHRWIDRNLEGTSVTVVLIGAETSTRPYVSYEIKKSYEKGNGLLGIYIHNIRNQQGYSDTRGSNPLGGLYVTKGFNKVCLSNLYNTYDWVRIYEGGGEEKYRLHLFSK